MGTTNGDSAPRVPLGGDYWQGDPGVPLWGVADTHAHLMAHLAFGGRAFWGQPYDPERPGEAGLEQALCSCAPIHGGLVNLNPEFGHQPGGGWPDFNIWPRFTTMVHQQVYLDWLHRAYQGGLRLVCCLAVNNELLASKTNPGSNHDDRSAIATQVAAMKDMVDWIDAQSGGEGQGWLQIAYTPQQASQIIGAGKLAVVLGVEVDSLGNWHHPEDLDRLARGDAGKARRLIALELDWLYELGIRQITPIHLANNAFGGTAIYLRFLELANIYISGKPWEVEDAFPTGIRYRLDQDGADLVSEIERRIAGIGLAEPPLASNRRTLIDTVPGLIDLVDRATASIDVKGGHANKHGLHPYGEILLEEMMKRGMIIDIDHMSQRATDQALDLAEQRDYPLISSHGSFRDLAYTGEGEFTRDNAGDYGTGDVHKVGHEGMKRTDQVERMASLGGLVAPILNQGDIAGLRQGLPAQAGKVPEPSAGSSTSWAQAYLFAVAKMGGRGVAIGSDVNGAAGLPSPRFGTFAAFGARTDARRIADRRGEIDRQTNGVRYDRPIREYRWFRFEESGPGAYSDDERMIWQGVAEYKAGFNPWHTAHPAGDLPENPNLPGVVEALHVRLDQGRVDAVAKGLWAAGGKAPTTLELATWPIEQQAAYLAQGGADKLGLAKHPAVKAWMDMIQGILARWDAMAGDNPPLQRCTAGPRRDWDINLDGMAHYGLLPDFLQDMRNAGLTPQDLAPLFRSAYDYVQLWQKCEEQAKAAAAAPVRAAAKAAPPAGRGQPGRGKRAKAQVPPAD